MVEEELTGFDDALAILVQTDRGNAVRVDTGHGLLDLLVVLAILFGNVR